ncbi:MAG: hypothetical protein ACW99A_20240 [Candidatus Kariarchaeaceae archaeon]|jgi:hypothetical protein
MAWRVVKEGWQNYSKNRRARSSGFASIDEYSQAVELGFLHKETKEFLQSTGFQTVTEMVSFWERVYFSANMLLKSYPNNLQIINDATTLQQMSNLEEHFEPYLRLLNQCIADLSKVLTIQTGITKLFRSQNTELFTTLEYDQLKIKYITFYELFMTATKAREELISEVKLKKEWYLQWEKYMTSMEIYPSKTSISLSKISEVISASLDQEEQRLLDLMDKQENIQDYEISPYIDKELGFQILMLMK